MKKWLIRGGLIAAAALLVAALVVVSGVVPVKASSGHWPITRWLLSFAMSRSVSTHSLGTEAPEQLDDDAWVMKGAGHFQTGCAFCHGSPVWSNPRVAQGLTPEPPFLSDTVPSWTDEELFHIVKHGVKFTGMPAFPSLQRDDEVWAVVAMLRRLPEMDADEYQRLVFGEMGRSQRQQAREAPQVVVQSCARCHGLRGQGRETSAFPRLAMQPAAYFMAAMKDYASEKRHSGMMIPIAAELSERQMQQAADYYAAQQPADEPAAEPLDAASLERGRAIANQGLPDEEVGACISCHRAGRIGHNPKYPALSGQFQDYLVLQLELFQQRHRGGSQAEVMHAIADGLDPQQIRDVAAFYASLPDTEDSPDSSEEPSDQNTSE